jgi:hypothetical protein
MPHDDHENEMHFRRARRGKAGEPLQLEATDRFQVAAEATIVGGRIIVVEDAIGTKLAAAFVPDAPAQAAPLVQAAPLAPEQVRALLAAAVPTPAPAPVAPVAPASSAWRSLALAAAVAVGAAAGGLAGRALPSASSAPAPVAQAVAVVALDGGGR